MVLGAHIPFPWVVAVWFTVLHASIGLFRFVQLCVLRTLCHVPQAPTKPTAAASGLQGDGNIGENNMVGLGLHLLA